MSMRNSEDNRNGGIPVNKGIEQEEGILVLHLDEGEDD